MVRWSTRIFFPLFFLLAGIYAARELFPRIEINTKTVTKTVIEHATPEIIQRVVYDTTFVTKWKTRIMWKTIRPDRVIEIPAVEIDTLNWAILSADLHQGKLTVDAYHLPDSRLLSYSFPIQSDFQLRLNQMSAEDPVVLLESRNIFDLAPRVMLGYNTGDGVFIRTRQRIWKLRVGVQGDQAGISAEGMVRVW